MAGVRTPAPDAARAGGPGAPFGRSSPSSDGTTTNPKSIDPSGMALGITCALQVGVVAATEPQSPPNPLPLLVISSTNPRSRDSSGGGKGTEGEGERCVSFAQALRVRAPAQETLDPK